MKIEMATKTKATLVHVDEDYIDMELGSSPNFFSYSIGSSPKSREFEFQMTCVSNEKPSPADDLFYKGKLLPLHLPPRLQMVQNLLQNNNATFDFAKPDSNLEHISPFLPFTTDDNNLRIRPTTAFASYSPLESSNNISTSESCRVSSSEVINPDEYSFGWSTNSDLNDLPKKSWPKKLKQMKQFLLGQRLKASRTYLRSLFSKSGCSDKSSASAAANINLGGGAEKKSSWKDCQNRYMKIFDDNKHHIACAVLKREMLEDDFSNHRKSFSGVVQRHCGTKSSSLSTSSSGSSSTSSSFSFSSAGYYDLQLFKRSISANYELEGSVEGAIAHCKQSQQPCSSKNTPDDDARNICSQFATKSADCGNKETATAALSSTRVSV